MDYFKESLAIHERLKGKLWVKAKKGLRTKKDLSLLYTPGVAEPCKEIAKSPRKAFELTIKANSVAVVSDGSSVLGLGNIGALAALPVMEGKALLFKELAGIDAFPICVQTQEPGKIIEFVKNLSPSFGGINLEDIAAPKCFEVEQSLQEIGIPVFHDDQHGTAIVVYAALLNALSVAGKKLSDARIAISGAGAAGIAVARLLLGASVSEKHFKPAKDLVLVDSKGVIYKGREELNSFKEEIAGISNKKRISGGLKEAISGADAFIGVSRAGIVSREMIKAMNEKAIVFAMSNPVPEIMPAEAKKAGAFVIGTGRSDFPNQINNALAFPGIFRGALDAGATKINSEMKLAAAIALAECVPEPEREKILPSILEKELVKRLAEAVKQKAVETRVVR